MYEVLWLEMKRRHLTNKQIGEVIGKHTNSVYNKIYGNTEISLEEAKKIHKTFFADMDFLKLFEKKEQSRPDFNKTA